MKFLRFFVSILFLVIALSACATVTSTTNREGPFVCAALPAALPISFPFQASSDLLVLNLGQSGAENDPPEVLTLNSDYTVSGGGYNSTTAMQTGTVTVISGGAHSVAVNDVIMVLRNVPVNQTTSLTTGILTAAAIEKALDKQATLSQQLTEKSSRALQFEAGETNSGILYRDNRAGFILGFDSDGDLSYYVPGDNSGGQAYSAGEGLDLVGYQFSIDPHASRFGNMFNVKDYGAVGDGTTDDLAAINTAIAALVDNSTLYFPPGIYKITGSFTDLAALNNIRVTGDGATIYSTVTGASGNTFAVPSSSSNVHFDNLRFVGSAGTRGNGIHIRLYSSYSSVTNCYFTGCSDFAVHVSNDNSDWNYGTRVENNTIYAPLGDGIHFGAAQNFVCSGNTLIDTGDDSIAAIADDVSYPPKMGTIIGNNIRSSGSAGIRINEASDILVEGNSVNGSVAAGIEVNRYLSTTAYNNRVNIKSNRVYDSIQSPGPRGAIWMNFCNDSSVTGNEVVAPGSGSGVALLDFNGMTIRGNTITDSVTRGIATDDSTTANVATNWYGLVIESNVIQSNVANEAIYVVPVLGKTINNVLITGNVGNDLPAGDWIFVSRVDTGVIGNNISRDGRTVTEVGAVNFVIDTPLFKGVGIGAVDTSETDLNILRSTPTSTAQASVVVGGALTAAYDLHPNAFRDITSFTPTVAADAYASFDAQSGMGGSVNLNHFRGFQFRSGFSGSGTLDNMSGFFNESSVGAGTVTAIKMFHGAQPIISGGTVGHVYGLYVDDLGSAGTLRHAIYTNGDDPWFSAGGSIFTSDLLALPAGALTARMGATFDQASQTGMAVMNKNATATGKLVTFHNYGGTEQGSITQTNSTTVAYNTTSDARLKKNMRDMHDSGEIIDQIKPRIFDWNWGGKDNHGFIAQELIQAYPEAVTVGGDTVDKPWSVDYSKLTPVLVAEVKSLRVRVERLEFLLGSMGLLGLIFGFIVIVKLRAK